MIWWGEPRDGHDERVSGFVWGKEARTSGQLIVNIWLT